MGSLRIVALFLLLAACTRPVTRDRWQHMSPREKDLYVRSLIGAEKVKERKGGNDRVFPKAAGEYIREIDAAYAHGDRRPVPAIFDDLGAVRFRR